MEPSRLWAGESAEDDTADTECTMKPAPADRDESRLDSEQDDAERHQEPVRAEAQYQRRRVEPRLQVEVREKPMTMITATAEPMGV